MIIFPLVDNETWLVCLECDTVPYHSTEKHLGALHEVVHHIFKNWHECFRVNEIEIYLFIGCDLESLITFDEIDGTSDFWNLMILSPFVSFWVDFVEIDLA